jgi:hypothetical protein
MNDLIPPAEETPETADEWLPEATAEAEPRQRRPVRIIGIALIIISVVLGWLLLVGFLGYQSGQRQLSERQENELLTNLERQTTLAADDLEQGNYELALVRLEWVLAREPDNREALRLQEAAQEAIAQNQSATAVPQPTASTPTNTPEPSPTPGKIASPEDELQRLRRLNVNKDWETAVPALTAFQQQFPSYEREETDQLLFEAYLGYSQSLFEGGQSELGLFYLEQAEKLGDLPQAMVDYRIWAELYTQGIAYYGVDWEVAAYYFRDLCLAAPFYQDACAKLINILVAHGDLYASLFDWCPAVPFYEEAAQYGAQVSEQLNIARNSCLAATPIPISGSVPLSGTQPITGAPAP